MSYCTWIGCQKQGAHPQLSKDGQQWANLCTAHDKELKVALTSGPRILLSAWVRAQGGAKRAAARV